MEGYNGLFADNFWRACETELHTQVIDMDIWTLFKRTKDMYILPGT